MRAKFLEVASYIKNFFTKDEPQKERGESPQKNSLKSMLNRFMDEGFGFWLDPFDTYRRSSITRAGPDFAL